MAVQSVTSEFTKTITLQDGGVIQQIKQAGSRNITIIITAPGSKIDGDLETFVVLRDFFDSSVRDLTKEKA